MTEPVPEASDVDLAEQSLPVSEPMEDLEFAVGAEADPADVFEQHQSVPLPDDDYDR